MFCSKCGNRNDEDVSFCRSCGTDLESLSLKSVKHNLRPHKNVGRSLTDAKTKDPDELTSDGIGRVVVGDGFFMVAVILSAVHSSVSSLLWLFLLIPAFYFFGKGLADVLHARQIRRREKRQELLDAPRLAALPPPRAAVVDFLTRSISGELAAAPSVTERTTRDLA